MFCHIWVRNAWPDTAKLNKNNKILIENFNKEKEWGAEKNNKGISCLLNSGIGVDFNAFSDIRDK